MKQLSSRLALFLQNRTTQRNIRLLGKFLPVLLALRQIGAEAGDAVYVSDSVTDLEAGRRAGTRVAAALWPKTAPGEREQFLKHIAQFTPEWLWERPADLTRSLAGWC